LAQTLVAGIAGTTGMNAATATNAATFEVENNYLSPKQSADLVRAKAQCAGGDAAQCATRDKLQALDATSRTQLAALGDACLKGDANACATGQAAVGLLTKIAKGEVASCNSGVVDCLAAYQPSARELSNLASALPGAGSGAVVPTADPITAAVLIRMGLANPYAGLMAGGSAAAGEGLNQRLYGDGTLNYERIANAAVLGAATAPLGGAFPGYMWTTLIGGASNAAATAYNNSQTGSADSVFAAGAVGMFFGGASKVVGEAAGLGLNRAMNFTRQFDPALGALLQPPGGRLVATPVQSTLPSTVKDLGTALLPAASGGVVLPQTQQENR
jgi:hypothetical protein